MVLLLALACASPTAQTPADTTVPADTGHDTAVGSDSADTEESPDTAETADTADGDGLLGARIDPPRSPPAFAVLDTDGVTRTEVDLIGHPTVLWFFREAEGST